MVPSAFSPPEQWRVQVAQIDAQLVRKDRDPEKFTNDLWPFVIAYRTDDERERLLRSSITKWIAAVFGRLHWSADPAAADELVRTFAISGTPVEVVEQLAAYETVLPHIALHTPYVPPIDEAASADAFRTMVRTFTSARP